MAASCRCAAPDRCRDRNVGGAEVSTENLRSAVAPCL